MNDGNGSIVHVLQRLTGAEEDTRELRQLLMDEMRSVRSDIKELTAAVRHLTEQVRDTGRAVDTLLAELRLRDKQEGDDV